MHHSVLRVFKVKDSLEFSSENVSAISQLSVFLVSVTVHLRKKPHLFTHFFSCFRILSGIFISQLLH